MYLLKTWTKFQLNIKPNLNYEFDQIESGFAIKGTRTHNDYVQEHTECSKLLAKTMLRSVRNALFQHDIAHNT